MQKKSPIKSQNKYREHNTRCCFPEYRGIVLRTEMRCSNCFGASTVERKKNAALAHRDVDGNLVGGIKNFAYNELRAATDNFHLSNKIGRGGFGTVYKGTLKGGMQVAVKTLSVGSRQGVREFLTEINTISNVKHPNLVELVGCCVHGHNHILVYEFVENNSLDRALLGTKSTNIKLDWRQRSSICMGTARGLAFLHEELVPKIVHRDIKASNILLNKDFNPKIGDFGLAKLFPDDITHISTRIAGTTYVTFTHVCSLPVKTQIKRIHCYNTLEFIIAIAIVMLAQYRKP